MRHYNPLIQYGAAGAHRRTSTPAAVCKFQGQIKKESDKAILFIVHLEDVFAAKDEKPEQKEVWFPLSQVKSIHRTFSAVNGTLDSIVVTEWIARQKNLVEEIS